MTPAGSCCGAFPSDGKLSLLTGISLDEAAGVPPCAGVDRAAHLQFGQLAPASAVVEESPSDHHAEADVSAHTSTRVLAPLERFDPPIPASGSQPPKAVLLIGKRKPYLNSTADAKRIERHVEQFRRLVQRFRDDPTLEPPPT
jgi:hypothetical protein